MYEKHAILALFFAAAVAQDEAVSVDAPAPKPTFPD
jgi:hypothetical protein